MADNKVSIELTIEDVAAMKSLENFSKKINRATKDTQTLGKGADNSFKDVSRSAKQMGDDLSKASSSGFGELVKGVTVANLASDAIQGIAGSIKRFAVDSINAAIAQENALNKLSAALKRSGEYSEEAMQDFQDFASEMQRQTIYGDEVTLQQLAIAKSFGLSSDRAKELVKAAMQLSATFGMSLESGVKNLGKSLSGLTGELGEALPMIKGLTAAQLKAGGAIQMVNTQFAGSAQAEMQTYQGITKSLSNAYGDMQEQLGFLITKNSLFKASLEGLRDATGAVGGLFKDLGTVINGTAPDQEQLIETLNTQAIKYAQLTSRIEAYQAQMSQFESGEMGFFEKLSFDAESARKQISGLASEQMALINQMNSVKNPEAPAGGGAGAVSVDQKTLDARRAMNAQLQQIYIEQAAWEAEQDLLKREITAENFLLELEQLQGIEQEKINAKYLAEEEKNRLIEDSVARQLATEASAQKKSLEIQKTNVEAEKKLKQQQVSLEQQKSAAILGVMGATANLAATIAKDGSKEQFLIQKAAALAQAVVAMNTAATLALAVPPAPNVGLAAYAKAAGAINIAAIVAATIKGYATGGIVDSSSRQGDKSVIRVNGGEAVLTESQQQRFMEIANGTRSGGGNLEAMLERLISAIENQDNVISIDGREIARSVKEQKEMGFPI